VKTMFPRDGSHDRNFGDILDALVEIL